MAHVCICSYKDDDQELCLNFAEKGKPLCREHDYQTTISELKRQNEIMAEALEFSNMTFEHAIALGYLGEGSTLGMANDAINKNNTAISKCGKVEK